MSYRTILFALFVLFGVISSTFGRALPSGHEELEEPKEAGEDLEKSEFFWGGWGGPFAGAWGGGPFGGPFGGPWGGPFAGPFGGAWGGGPFGGPWGGPW